MSKWLVRDYSFRFVNLVLIVKYFYFIPNNWLSGCQDYPQATLNLPGTEVMWLDPAF